MTHASERLRESHRGLRRAASAAESRLSALTRLSVPFRHLDEITVLAFGEYRYNLALGSWTHASEFGVVGYTIPGMIQDHDRRRHTNPAEGRDSEVAGPISESGNTPAIAESSAGAPTSAALPEVWP